MRALHHITFRHASLLLLGLMACSSPPGTGADGGTDGGTIEPPPVTTPPDVAGEVAAVPVANPTAPKADDGWTPPWPAAPAMAQVNYVPNRDSVVMVVPAVTGARDYRVFRIPAGVTIADMNGAEQVNGAIIHCAGYRQHNDKFTGTRELLRVIEVTDVQGPTTLVVEALDTPCPYSGAMAPQHEDIQVTIDEVPPIDRIRFSLYTPAEIRARFGSLILNGHGQGPTLGVPGPTTPPKVPPATAVTAWTSVVIRRRPGPPARGATSRRPARRMSRRSWSSATSAISARWILRRSRTARLPPAHLATRSTLRVPSFRPTAAGSRSSRLAKNNSATCISCRLRLTPRQRCCSR